MAFEKTFMRPSARFPSTVLRPGETYSSVTEWHFYVK